MDRDVANSQRKPRFVVGVGASAGGLEALEELFQNMPTNTGMSFVVVQHLSPDYKSMMSELLSKTTEMQIQRIEDGDPLLPDTIHLIPPKQNLTLHQGKLVLMEQPIRRGLTLPIDIFFRSLAKDAGAESIAIILSGTGSDGTLGVREIKECGGMVMVQDPGDAKFDGMPRSLSGLVHR